MRQKLIIAARIISWVMFVAGCIAILAGFIWFCGLLRDPYAIAPQERPPPRVVQMAGGPPQTASPGRYTPIYARQVPAEQRGTVWVNIPSHIYHYPGYHWYGHTQHGKYLREEDAIAEGDRAALNERRPLDFMPTPTPSG